MYLNGVNLNVSHSTISGNKAPSNSPRTAGIYMFKGSATVSDSDIANNFGVGFYFRRILATVSDSTITDNAEAGMYLSDQAVATISNTSLISNSSYQWFLSDATSTINISTCLPGTYFVPSQSQKNNYIPGYCPVKCLPGTYAEGTSHRAAIGCNMACPNCPVGTYCNDTGVGTPMLCPAGTYGMNSGIKDSACSGLCAPGHFCPKGSTRREQFLCPVGRYRGDAGAGSPDECVPCGLGKHCVGQLYSIACAAGKFSDVENATACSVCPAGWHRDANMGFSDRCESCAAGRYQPLPGKPACLDCIPGMFNSQTGRNTESCDLCAAGQASSSGASSCRLCDRGQTTPAGIGASVCSGCEKGTYGAAPGRCDMCEPGKYQGARGMLSCTLCPANTYNEEHGSPALSSCRPCASDYAPHTTTSGATGIANRTTGCICAGAVSGSSEEQIRNGYYISGAKSRVQGDVCLPCPTGALCKDDGMSLESISAKPGHWRASPRSVYFPACSNAYQSLDASELAQRSCCPDAACHNLSTTILNQGLDLQCARGSAGILCGACAEGYVKSGSECVPCPGGARFEVAIASILGICAGGLLAMTVYLVYATSIDAISSRASPVFNQIKIMISFLQIFASMPVVMGGVPFPTEVLVFTIPLQIFNLNLPSLFSTTACSLSLGFIRGTIIHISVPLLVTGSLVVSWWLGNMLSRDKRPTAVASRRSKVVKALIFSILLLYPGLATRLFTLFKCVEIDGIPGKSFLEADWSVQCYAGDHASMVGVGIKFMFLYIVGIPASMLLFLVKHRKALHNPRHPRHEEIMFEFGGIYAQYEPRYYVSSFACSTNSADMNRPTDSLLSLATARFAARGRSGLRSPSLCTKCS